MSDPSAPPGPLRPSSTPLPLLPAAVPVLRSHPDPVLGSDPAVTCDLDDGCITCGDVAVALRVVEVGPYDARCVDDDGNEELVAIELIGPVAPGDRVLVHAKVALEKLTEGGDA